jgi:hypothetical protein
MQLPDWGGSSSSSPSFPAQFPSRNLFLPGVWCGARIRAPGACADYKCRSTSVLPGCRLLRTRYAKPAKDVKAAFYVCNRSKIDIGVGNSSRAANRMRGIASRVVRTAACHAESPRGEYQSEICSSVRPRVGGPNTPTETTTTSMARAIKAKTPAVPERWKRNPIIRLVNAVDKRPQE